MIITSLIFLLLFNSITLRRDKSILYSRATITMSHIKTKHGHIATLRVCGETHKQH